MTRNFSSGNPKPTFKEIIKGLCFDFLALIVYSWEALKWIGIGILIVLAIEGIIAISR